jgi:hypothetical protein
VIGTGVDRHCLSENLHRSVEGIVVKKRSASSEPVLEGAQRRLAQISRVDIVIAAD